MKYLNSFLQGTEGDGLNAIQNLLQPYSEERFQKGVVDPAMKTFNQQIIPGIENRFSDAGASSALNQTLASSSEDLANTLAGQRINYEQLSNQNNISALQQILGLLGQRTFQPQVYGPQPGIFGDVLSAGARFASGGF